MNKRFILKLIKYMTVFFLINFIVSVAFIGWMTYILVTNLYNSLSEIEPDYLDMYNIYEEPNDNLNNLAKKERAMLYFTKKNGDIIYPKHLKSHNIRSLILKNMNYANSVKSQHNSYLVFIYKNNNKSQSLINTKHISTEKLLSSIQTHDFNKYNYVINNNSLYFIKNSNFRDYNNSYELGYNSKNATIGFLKIGSIFLLINIIFVSITAFLISRRLTKPLSYYIDWISNLSLGKLHQPTSTRKRRKNRKTYPELDKSLYQLNQQMLNDKFYNNQINYYKSKWISQISHDLKSPLTTIYGYSKLIHTDEQSQPYAQLITEKATFMNDLIDSLNQTFDMETNQMKQDKERFPVQSTACRITQVIGYHSISLHFNILEDATFYGNKLYFERLLINLINNSIEHNEINPNIEITFSNIQNKLVIDYIDDGRGIPHDHIDELFKQSYTSKENKDKHGIGLSIIQDAVNFHNGSIALLPSKSGVHFHIILIDES